MAYIGSSPTKVVSRQSANIFTYTATANQTAFTGADANGNTLACSPSDIMVHMNGIKLEEIDYTATTTTVTLGSGAAAGDEVTITAFLTFESADHYTKSAADTRYVNASGDTMSGGLNVTGGNVGIGTSSPTGVPTTTLHINGTTNAGIHLTDSASGATDSDGVYLSMDNPNLYIQNKEAGFTSFETSGTERMKIDSSGRVTMPYQPMFHAWCTDGGNNAVSGNSSPTSFYASLNVGSHFSSGTFTAPIAGKYRFYASILTGAANGGYGLYQFTVNNSGSFGGGINSNWGQGYNYGTANDKNITRELIVDLAANDYVKLQVSGTNANLYWAGGYSYFGGHLIG